MMRNNLIFIITIMQLMSNNSFSFVVLRKSFRRGHNSCHRLYPRQYYSSRRSLTIQRLWFPPYNVDAASSLKSEKQSRSNHLYHHYPKQRSSSSSTVLSSSTSHSTKTDDIVNTNANNEDAYEECWMQTSWTCNPNNDTSIDTILQGLISPAPQSYYVLRRALAEAFQKMAIATPIADDVKPILNIARQLQEICDMLRYSIKTDYAIVFNQTFLNYINEINRSIIYTHAAKSQERQSLSQIQLSLKEIPYFIQPGIDWSIVLRQSSKRSTSGQQPMQESSPMWVELQRERTLPNNNSFRGTTLQLAKELLDIQLDEHYYNDNERMIVYDNDDIDSKREVSINYGRIAMILRMIRRQLDVTLGTDLRGRTAADTAFTLSLAGSTDTDIYNVLAKVTKLELQRTAHRPSHRIQDTLHIIEKLAASGIRNNDDADIAYRMVANKLRSYITVQQQNDAKTYSNHSDGSAFTISSSDTPTNKVIDLLQEGSNHFHLLQPRPLLWLWRFSSKLDKVEWSTADKLTSSADKVVAKRSCASPINWTSKFQDCSKPLVIDIGCGFGVSLLGLASRDKNNHQEHIPKPSCIHNNESNNMIDDSSPQSHWVPSDHCNYVGCDLNRLGTQYSNGMAIRWNLTDRLSYCNLPADEMLDQVAKMYPLAGNTSSQNNIAYILVQFPTPYQLPPSMTPKQQNLQQQKQYNQSSDHHIGNSQLPVDPELGFMISSSAMSKIATLIKESRNEYASLIIQSNCEDVAVHLCNLAKMHGLHSVPATYPVSSFGNDDTNDTTARLPLRTKRWLEQGGTRAIGKEWSVRSLLPTYCATETEVACEIQGNPVHRCLLTKSQ